MNDSDDRINITSGTASTHEQEEAEARRIAMLGGGKLLVVMAENQVTVEQIASKLEVDPLEVRTVLLGENYEAYLPIAAVCLALGIKMDIDPRPIETILAGGNSALSQSGSPIFRSGTAAVICRRTGTSEASAPTEEERPMTTVISEVYTAFLSAGIPEDKAIAAAKALTDARNAPKGDIEKIVYEAFLLVGVSENKARAAAKAMADN